MAVDVPAKIAHLISDFWAVQKLVEAIEHELERRIVARLALVKIDAIADLLALYQGPAGLEPARERLQSHRRDGLQAVRRALAGRSPLDPEEIGESWLYLKRSAIEAVSEDLRALDGALKEADPAYPGAVETPTISWLRAPWTRMIGDPAKLREVNMYAGVWPRPSAAAEPGNASLHDVTLRTVALMTSLFQATILSAPITYNFRPAIYRRLFYEMRLLDLTALEEAVYSGTRSEKLGPARPSMIEAWESLDPPHPGVAMLKEFRAKFPPDYAIWKEKVRDRLVAPVDPDVPADALEIEQWPFKPGDLDHFVGELSRAIHFAAQEHPETSPLFVPPTRLDAAAATDDPLRWDDVGRTA